MQKYDAMYIICPNIDDEAKKAVVADMTSMLNKFGASNVNVKEWGMRKLAYEINDFKEGYYVDVEFEAENPEVLAEYDRVANIKEAILRHIVVKLPEKK